MQNGATATTILNNNDRFAQSRYSAKHTVKNYKIKRKRIRFKLFQSSNFEKALDGRLVNGDVDHQSLIGTDIKNRIVIKNQVLSFNPLQPTRHFFFFIKGMRGNFF